jgi:hypothetical protein
MNSAMSRLTRYIRGVALYTYQGYRSHVRALFARHDQGRAWGATN